MLSKNWDLLPPDLMSSMRKRLGSEFATFAEFCESSGMLQNNFLPLAETTHKTFGKTDTGYLCSIFASTIVSGANGFGANEQFENAIKLAHWALALEPSHLPALMCLANVHMLQEDPKELAAVQKRIDALKKRLHASPQAKLSSFEKGMIEALRQTES